MTARPKLAAVPAEPVQRVDIQALNRADIERRDWSRCHIDADRRKPISLPDSRKWGWL
jgi:hypothetical protein